MKYSMLAVVLMAVMGSAALAEGVPSKSKLGSLGLSSLNVQNDEAGMQVRGKGFGSMGFSVLLTAGPNQGGWNGALVFGQDPITIGTLRTGDLGNVDATNNLVPFTLQFSNIQAGVVVSQQVSVGFGHMFTRGAN